MKAILSVVALLACCCVLGIGAAVAGPTVPAAAPVFQMTADLGPSSSSLAPALDTDPFVALAVVSTAIAPVHQCDCMVIVGCTGHPAGTDCAEPPGCCHCSALTPSTCVRN